MLAAAPIVQIQPSPAAYASAVTQICGRAMLFEGTHSMGTRVDALAIASDIRASARRRLERVEAVPAPARRRGLVLRWITLERRLAALYARNWVRIFDAIDTGDPGLMHRIVHDADALRREAARLEHRLHVPDCTGG